MMPATFGDLSCMNLFSSEAAKPEWTMTSKVLKFLRTEERSLPFSGYNFVMRMSQSFGKHLCHMCHKEHDMHILPTNSTNSKNALISLSLQDGPDCPAHCQSG